MKHINSENLSEFAFVNTECLVYPLRGVCVCFHGYTDGTVFESAPEIARVLGREGIVWVFPYFSVWGWMGRASTEFCEQVLDALWEKLGLNVDIPLVSTGGSMGGMTALMYCVKGKRKAVACAADCPVTDMWKYYLHDRYARRAILSAYIAEAGKLEDLAKENSPLYNAEKLPRIPYFLLFGENDTHITCGHMPPMVESMKKLGLDVTVRIEKGMGHCAMDSFPEAFDAYCGFILGSVEGNR